MADQKPVKSQSILIINPNNPEAVKAVIDIWFIGDDIVLGGLGWYEYGDYEKMKKNEHLQADV